MYKPYDVDKVCKLLVEESVRNKKGSFTAYLSMNDDGYTIKHNERYGQNSIPIAIATAANGVLTYLAPWAGQKVFTIPVDGLSNYFWEYGQDE